MPEHRSPGLERAVQAVTPPRRGADIDAYQTLGARRERRRLALSALCVVLTLLVAGLFLAWEAHNAVGVTYSHWGILGKPAGDDYDEGAYLLSAQLLLKGYPLFQNVFSAQPALFLPALALAVRLIPDPLAAGHLFEALCGVVVLLSLGWMAWTAYRPAAAPLAAALLAVSPGFLLYAHTVEAEMPMLAFCILAVAAAQSYYLTTRRALAVLAGLFLAVGTEMKLLSVVVLVPLLLLLAGGARRRYRMTGRWCTALYDLIAFLLACAIPALVLLIALAPTEQIRQVILFHLQASNRLSFDGNANLQAMGVFLGYDPGLLVAALAGTIVALVRLRHTSRLLYLPLVYSLWVLTMLPFLWRYHPLLQHQFVPLLPPLALLGSSLSMALPWQDVSRKRLPVPDGRRAHQSSMAEPHRAAWRTPLITVAALALAIYLPVLGLRTLVVDAHIFTPSVTPARDLLSRLIDARTTPGDFVVCDDPMVALGAHRLPPPGMEDPSMVRVDTGYLTSAQAIAATERYHVALVVTSRPRIIDGVLRGTVFSFSLPGYLAWLRAHYHPLPVPVPHAQIYARRGP